MKDDHRKPAHEVTTRHEDSGLFKSRLVELSVDLAPLISQNARQDILIKGFVDGASAVDVVFAGRRRTKARALIARLQDLYARTQRAAGPSADIDADKIRLQVRIEGSWRPRFRRDDQGWETRAYQLYAARWLVIGHDGTPVTYGDPPQR